MAITEFTTCKENNHFVIHPLDPFNEKNQPELLAPGSRTLLWVKKGEGLLQMQDSVMHIDDSTVYCSAPGQQLYLQTTGKLNGYYISLSAPFFYISGLDFYIPVSLPGRLSMDSDTCNDTGELMERMLKEYASHNALRMPMLKGLFNLFLLYLSGRSVLSSIALNNTRDSLMVSQFKDLVRAHIKEKKMVADYASALNVTPGHLNQVVKKVSGFTASYHIQQQVVQEAKRLALASASSMKEIAYGLGFDDTAHFSKFFKTNTGVNFSHFKREISAAYQ